MVNVRWGRKSSGVSASVVDIALGLELKDEGIGLNIRRGEIYCLHI